MGVLIVILFIFALLVFPFMRYFLFHPIKCGKQAILDIYKYVKYKKQNICPFYGQIYMFVASGSKAFGSGKTLSMVEWLRFVYDKYNNKLVWSETEKKFVRQNVIIISNVKLNDIPYIPFVGRDQFVNIDKLDHKPEDVIIYAIDEAGAEFNSRNYKDNLPTDFLVRLLQVRHNKCAFAMTAQRFNFVDKLLRNVTGIVTTCEKKWRIVRLREYDAFSLETAVNSDLIQPLTTRFYFATDRLYNSYDTLYNVEKLKAQLEDGDLLDTAEILERVKGDGLEPIQAGRRLKKAYKVKR